MKSAFTASAAILATFAFALSSLPIQGAQKDHPYASVKPEHYDFNYPDPAAKQFRELFGD